MQDGQIITDGSVKWQICDTRIPFPVGYVIHDRVLRPGFIKVNKATILRNDFIRLYKWVNDNGLIIAETLKNSDIKYSSFFGTGNGSTTFSLPDERGIVERGLDDGRGLDVGRQLGTYQAATTIDSGVLSTSLATPSPNQGEIMNIITNADGVITIAAKPMQLSAQWTRPQLSQRYSVRVCNVSKIAQIKY